MKRQRLLGVWIVMVGIGAAASCGGRTGLLSDDLGASPTSTSKSEAGPPSIDASVVDSGFDGIPGIDVQPNPDVDRSDCPDADATFIYVVTEENELYSFYPPGLSFKLVGKLVCPSPPGQTPFSMAVDRKGVAYVVYTDGRLYRVSTATAACTTTPYTANQLGWTTFGMGFVSENGGPNERLYVSRFNPGENSELGVIDTSTFRLSRIGPFSPPVPRSELTGTGDGRLFAYWPLTGAGLGSRVAEIEKQSGKVIASSSLPVGSDGDAFAFAFWGGDFWIFTGRGGTSVHRFRPTDGSTTTPTTHASTIVGAGVSTCAPQL
jgi:hypothetical protein